MNAIARSLAVVVALSATPALAHEERPLPVPPAPVQVAPPYGQPYAARPWADPVYAAPPAPPLPGLPGWAPRHGGQLRALQLEYRRLEEARERFYAGWRGNPRAQRRFETWYAGRRAELDQRYAWLAGRREHRGPGRFAWNEHERHGD